MPDFFIVGHPKSGTTALYEMLRRHPQIFMPEHKEPVLRAASCIPRPPPRPRSRETLEEYLALFARARAGAARGRGLALYLWSRTAAARIAAVAPDARIIAILREPASFLRSLHLQFLRDHVETEQDFAPGARAGASGARPRAADAYWPGARLLRARPLRRAAAPLPRRVPARAVLVLIYDDFRADNEATVRRVLRFLEVDDTAPIEPREANPTVRVRSPAR